MSSFSDLQLLGAAGVYGVSGVLLMKAPSTLLDALRPVLAIVEEQTGLPPYKGGDEALAFIGMLLFTLAYFYGMAAYTLDEKFKRNSTPGRVIFSVAGFHVCQRTPHGNSLVALLSIFHLATGLLMGLTVGWGDGNAVDLEIADEKARVEQRAQKDRAAAVEAAQPK